MDAGYDIPSIARDLDWIAVMTYDYHGHWDKKTGHVSPMYAHPEDDYDYFNTVSCIFFYHHFNVIRDQKCQRIKILSGTLILSKQILHLLTSIDSDIQKMIMIISTRTVCHTLLSDLSIIF